MTYDERGDAMRASDRPVRLLRSVAAALVCVLASATGHLSAGGTLPPTATVAVFAGAAAVVWLLSPRRITPGQLLGLLVLCQVCIHLGAGGSEMSMGAAMVAGHVVATTVSALALARGEQLVWQLAERLALRVMPLLRAVLPAPSSRQLPPVVSGLSLHAVHLAHSRWSRGPPSGLA